MDLADWYWIGLGVAFALFELGAAIWRPRWTLSVHVWEWFSIGKRKPYWWLRRFILAGLLVSLGFHLFSANSTAVPVVLFCIGIVGCVWFSYGSEAQ